MSQYKNVIVNQCTYLKTNFASHKQNKRG